jgi:pilus assembly protein Flp/PilA
MRTSLNDCLVLFYVRIQNLAHREDGQDLVEYALLVALIALAAIGGVRHVATAVTTVFTNISSSLA